MDRTSDRAAWSRWRRPDALPGSWPLRKANPRALISTASSMYSFNRATAFCRSISSTELMSVGEMRLSSLMSWMGWAENTTWKFLSASATFARSSASLMSVISMPLKNLSFTIHSRLSIMYFSGASPSWVDRPSRGPGNAMKWTRDLIFFSKAILFHHFGHNQVHNAGFDDFFQRFLMIFHFIFFEHYCEVSPRFSRGLFHGLLHALEAFRDIVPRHAVGEADVFLGFVGVAVAKIVPAEDCDVRLIEQPVLKHLRVPETQVLARPRHVGEDVERALGHDA